jgi:hypothetical protein
MTAINVVQRPHAIHMLTDAASYTPDGTLGAIGPKAHPVPHLNAVFSSRGPRLFMPLVGEYIFHAFASFDQMVDGLVLHVRAATEAYAPTLQRCAHGASFDLVVAGWSTARKRPETYVLTDHENYGFAAWTLQPFGSLLITPWDADLAGRLKLTQAELAGKLDPVKDGLRILEAQRFVKAIQRNETEAAHGVGGFAQLTTVTAENITTRILKRWPDPIGEKLDPTRRVQ